MHDVGDIFWLGLHMLMNIYIVKRNTCRSNREKSQRGFYERVDIIAKYQVQDFAYIITRKPTYR